MAHNHHNHGRSGGSRRSNTELAFGIANLFNVIAGIFAGYVGAQHRAELDRVKAENMQLKNRIAEQNVGKAHNDVIIGDLTIEEKLLKIELLKQKLGLSGGDFKATDYPEPGNIREEERRR